MIKTVKMFVCRSKVNGHYRNIDECEKPSGGFDTENIEDATFFSQEDVEKGYENDPIEIISDEQKPEDFEFVPVEVTYKIE